MTKGGSRNRSGPQADPRSGRSDSRGLKFTALPSEGFDGDVPEFDLPEATPRELEVWADLWATPQAAAWEDLGWTRVVARYAAIVLACERPDATSAIMGEARQLEDRLGLSPMAMKRLQWEIGPAAAVKGDGVVANIADYRDLYG